MVLGVQMKQFIRTPYRKYSATFGATEIQIQTGYTIVFRTAVKLAYSTRLAKDVYLCFLIYVNSHNYLER